MFGLHLRLYLLLALLFGIIYSVLTVIGAAMGLYNFYIYVIIGFGLMFLQYMIGPKLVELSMRVEYVDKKSYPELHNMVEELAQKAHIPTPRIGIARISIPNAFAFGRGFSDSRVCVSESLMRLLSEGELKAVIGHEISHIKNRDVLTITLLSVIPMILYYLAWNFFWFGGGRRRSQGGGGVLIGLAAFVLYFITNLLVLYGSRIREYFADQGSVALGNKPKELASALYKLVYGSARMDKRAIKDSEGLKAFFVNDPSRATKEIRELAEIDSDKSGTIDSYELAALRNKKIQLSFGDRLMEILSTHPNMLKRIQQLSAIKA
ncbi:MAG: M48 family metalloprotease [Candidatus Omnitrophica bacterium]|nr:M48 family metalloprotease [Candidatus Omnitrophota bacterium]